MQWLVDAVSRLSYVINRIAGWIMIALMVLTCLDVILRLLWKPIFGAYEVVGFLGAGVISLALAQTTIERAHVSVHIVLMKVSHRLRQIAFFITSLLIMVLFGIITFEAFKYGTDIWIDKEVSLTLEVPVFPILYGIGSSSAIVFTICLIDVLLVFRSDSPWEAWSKLN